MVVMDCDTFEYQYGDTEKPDPAQRDLDALLPTVTRICVLEGAMCRGRAMGGRVLIDLADAPAIRELAVCLRIVEDPRTFNHCCCLGGPTIELYAGLDLVATIGVQHGKAIRWQLWYYDAQLAAGDRLTRWLHHHGIDRARLDTIYQRGINFSEQAPASADENEAHRLCAEAQERAQAGKLAEALQLCTRALELGPELAGAYALRGQVHFHLGRVPEAVADCTAAIARGVRHAELYFIRAIGLDAVGRVDEALADCSMALHLDPEYAGAYNGRALIRTKLGRIEEALSDYAEAIRVAPHWVLPYLNRAQLAHGQGQLEAAIEDYDRAIAAAQKAASGQGAGDNDPTVAIAYCRRGEARFDQFREEDAEADFDEAHQRHPAAAAAFLGDMWLRRNSFGRALELFSQLIRLQPEDASAYVGRGLAEEAVGELDQAVADYTTAIRLRPEAGPAYFFRARVRHRQEASDDALADLSEHLRLHPSDTFGNLFRSTLHKARGDLAAAFADLHAAHRAAPNDPHVCNNLAWMLATCADAQLRDGTRSVALARQACEATEWKNAFCLGTLGAALAETGAYAEAIHWQSEALELYPDDEKPAGQARLELYRNGRPYHE
jgi:tetratricopeptide (TPR) repeat protein